MLRAVDRSLAIVSVAAAALVLVLLFAGPSLVGAKSTSAPAATSTGGAAGKSSGGAAGKSSGGTSTSISGAGVFASAGCSTCHTLKAAGASGTVGPDLDQLQPSADQVSSIVRSGGAGMPSFSSKLSDAQIAAVATYVSTVAGR